jgi:hypothetical protein
VLITFFTYEAILNYYTAFPFASTEIKLWMLCIINDCNSGNMANENLNCFITCPLSPSCEQTIWKKGGGNETGV